MLASDTYRSCRLIIKIYFLSFKILHKIFEKLYSVIFACFTGFWLGLLKREDFHLIDELYFNNSKMYYKEGYNKRGLWNWEKEVINKYFYLCKKLLLIGVGGGREYLALHNMGYDIDGFECNPKLVEYANALLEKEGIFPNIQISSRDACQYGMKVYDGIIIGWGAYLLIQEKERRIALLRNLRNQLKENSPVLLSFFCRSDAEHRFKVVSTIGNTIRRLFRRNFLEVGDYLNPNYVHYFTREEIASEMQEAEFQLVLYATDSYGHAVGIAR
jgi:Tellurite resistance protein TehB